MVVEVECFSYQQKLYRIHERLLDAVEDDAAEKDNRQHKPKKYFDADSNGPGLVRGLTFDGRHQDG